MKRNKILSPTQHLIFDDRLLNKFNEYLGTYFSLVARQMRLSHRLEEDILILNLLRKEP